MTKLVLFIHGLGGDAAGTWKKFPELIRSDSELAALYDIESFEYSTGASGSKPSLPTVAAILKTEIDNRYKDYSDIALIAHSQGGLIARWYIAERLNSHQPLRVSRLLTFATPHHGSGFATWLSWLPFASQQTQDLDPNSEFLKELAIASGQAQLDRHVLTKYAVAADDAIVGQVSAMGQWSPGYETTGAVGHISSVKPESASDMSFLVAKNFLREESLAPGGVEADYTAPLLPLPYAPSDDRTRFIFSARVLQFIGREAEEHFLADFLDSSGQTFRWMVMHGSGGVGKSRLALELCLAIRNEWHAGFLQDAEPEPDPVWGKWQPLLPTLIVIDAAAQDTQRTGKVLRALAGRGPAYGTARLAAPVRVLLVERTGEAEWLKNIMGDETRKAQLALARAPNLPLATIDDPWPIFIDVLDKTKKPLPDKTETLAALEKIDPERRPLYAYFMADAIARGVDIRQFDAADLLEEVIEHGRKSYWQPAGATAKDERLLAVATMAGGLPVSAVKGVKDELLPSWNIDHHPKVFLAMTGQKSGQNIAPLKPDIVGEKFALTTLADENLSDEDRERFCGLAWGLGTLGMMHFMLRAHRDLPHHAMLPWVRKSPPAEGEQQLFWSMAAHAVMIDLRSRDPDAARELLRHMRGAAASVDEYWERLEVKWTKGAMWELWAKAAAFSIGGDIESLLQNSVLAGPTGIQTKSSAKTGFFFENLLVSRDPVAARGLLDEMRDVAKERDEASLWKTWAYAALALMEDLVSRDPVAAWTLLGDIVSVTAAKHGEDSTWEAMMSNIVNAAVLTWLDKTREVAAERDEATLWEQWAKVAHNLVSASRDPVAARTLLDDMRGVAEARDEAPLWEWWAKAARGLLEELASSDPASAQALMDNIIETMEKHPGAALFFLPVG